MPNENLKLFSLLLDSCRLVSCCPAFFDLLILLGQQGLIILLLKSRPNLGPHRVIPYSPMKC